MTVAGKERKGGRAKSPVGQSMCSGIHVSASRVLRTRSEPGTVESAQDRVEAPTLATSPVFAEHLKLINMHINIYKYTYVCIYILCHIYIWHNYELLKGYCGKRTGNWNVERCHSNQAGRSVLSKEGRGKLSAVGSERRAVQEKWETGVDVPGTAAH